MRRSTSFMMRMCGMALALCTFLVASATYAEVNGQILTTGKKSIKGAIRYIPSAKSYAVRSGGAEVNVPLDQVAEIKVDKPADLDAAIGKVRAGQGAAAVTALQKVAKDYAMLEHDVTATRWLAEAFFKIGQADKGAAACEEVARNYPVISDPGFANIYWDCLLKTEQYAKLDAELTKIAERAPRPVAAVAQMKRGDMAKQKGDLKAALVEGYLRTVYFFQSEKGIQPEALYKTVKTLEELGRINDADKWRKKLLTDFPEDQYSQQLKGQ